jgi:hypothetical protein
MAFPKIGYEGMQMELEERQSFLFMYKLESFC